MRKSRIWCGALASVGLAWLMIVTAGCELLALYAAYEFVDGFINKDKGDPTTRIVYRVESAGAGNPKISGARIQLFALRTGGDPTQPGDFDTVADAIRETNDDGEALVFVKNNPNEPGDNVIRPATVYREVISAPGFQTYEGVRQGIGERDGLVQPEAIRLVPIG